MTHYPDINRPPKDLTIGDKRVVNLDHLIDVESLNDMRDELAHGIARAMPFVEPVVIGSLESQYDMRIPEVEVMVRVKAVEDSRLANMILAKAPRQVIYDYVKFAYPTVALGKKILLRTYRNYHAGFGMKHLARMNYDTPAYVHFKALREWINQSHIFSEVGRVIIFLTERGAEAEVHCDYADGKTRKDQFIWLNPGQIKKFFVLDSNFKKHYLPGVVNTFDNASWHGGDPSNRATFSIRIDGKFSDEFLKLSEMYEHFKE